jgi:hypothetical protein
VCVSLCVCQIVSGIEYSGRCCVCISMCVCVSLGVCQFVPEIEYSGRAVFVFVCVCVCLCVCVCQILSGMEYSGRAVCVCVGGGVCVLVFLCVGVWVCVLRIYTDKSTPMTILSPQTPLFWVPSLRGIPITIHQ